MFKDCYNNKPVCKATEVNQPYVINVGSYVPASVQIANLLASGERLAIHRQQMFTNVPLSDEDGNPYPDTMQPSLDSRRNFDVFTALDVLREINKSAEARKKQIDKLNKEHYDKQVAERAVQEYKTAQEVLQARQEAKTELKE